MKRKGRLGIMDTSLGSIDDAFYIAESVFKKEGEIIGKAIGLTPKQIKRKNLLLKNVRGLESKGHFTHSTIQRNQRFLEGFSEEKSILDSPKSKIRKKLKRFPIKN